MYTVFNFEWKINALNSGNLKMFQSYLKALSFDTQTTLT